MPSMGGYSWITSKVSYQALALIAPALTLLSILFVLWHGVALGIDFKGGTWMDVLTDRNITSDQMSMLSSELSGMGLKDVKVSAGYDIESRMTKLTVVTTSVVNESAVKGVLQKYAGDIIESDYALVPLASKPPADLSDKLNARFSGHVSLNYSDGVLKLTALELDQRELASALEYYLGVKVEPKVAKKNFNVRSVGPTLGDKFREQGTKAIVISFILMAIVVFMSFREIIPSFAVMLAAICDATFAFGAMVFLGIPLEPATLAALLMIIGYSVDTDVLLTARTLKQKIGGVNESIDDALKTGITMTGTTLIVMTIMIVISKMFTQIDTLYNIAVVLFFGLLIDIPATWFTNAGIIKWYLESPSGRKFRYRK